MADPILFILASPYSRASLVSAMLGQHPEMIALPDTNLFVADNIEAVSIMHGQTGNGVSDGLLRLLAQLHEGNQSDDSVQQAKKWLDEHGAWTTRQLLDSVYQQLAIRFMIDASPVNVMNEHNLKRLYNTYPDANFLHLTRHPHSVAVSYLEGHGSRWNAYRRDDNDMDEEQIWLKPNSMISNFSMSLPEGQCMRLMVEELLAQTDNYLLQIAQWLNLSTAEESITAMLYPEKMLYAHYGPPSAPCGMETEFLEQPAISAETEAVSLTGLKPPFEKEFSPGTLKLAREYGYK
jgi:Sulfotransferase family